MIDNRIKSLISSGILTNVVGMDIPQNIRLVQQMNILLDNKEGRSGVYTLIREVSDDEWTVIDGVLNLKPQRGISIPKIL